MSEAHVRVAGNTLGWDGYALSWQTKETKRSLYLVSPDSVETLYSSRPSSSLWGFLLGERIYRITADTSAVASLISNIRHFVGTFVKFVIGDHLSLYSALSGLSLFGMAAVLLGPQQLLAECLVLTSFLVVKDRLSQERPQSPLLYPLTAAAVAGVAIGVFTWYPAALSVNFIVSMVCMLLERLGVNFTQPQDVAELIQSPGLGGVLMGAYACIGAPLAEEFIFRSMLRDYFSLSESKKENGFWDRFKQRIKVPFTTEAKTGFNWERTKTVLKTSIIFGLVHGSVRQGWSNIPIVLSCTLSGIIFALLRELTGNLWASTTLHGVWNLIATLRCREIIPPIPGCE